MGEVLDVEMSGEGGVARRVTVEGAAWAAVGLLAAVLRLYQLGLRPLDEGEAAQALAAFRFVRGDAPMAAATSPALFTGNVLGFSLLGASDITARWLPALVGVALVLLPLGLRHRLGRRGALAAALLLAVSPTAVYFSRTLDGAILAATCSLALAVGLIRALDSGEPRALYLAAGALGVGLCTGPAFWTFLLILASFVLSALATGRPPQRKRGSPPTGGSGGYSAGGLMPLQRELKRGTGWPRLVAAWRGAEKIGGRAGTAGAVAAATFGLVATTMVLHPAGVGDAADLIGAWVTGFFPELGGQPMLYPAVLLLRYEPLILLLGLVETGRAVWGKKPRKGETLAQPVLACSGGQARAALAEAGQGENQARASFPHTAFLAFWALAGTVLVLVAGHRPAGNILLVVVPWTLLAGQGMERTWRWVGRHSPWREAGAVGGVALGLAAFLYLQVGAYSLTDPASKLAVAGLTLPNGVVYVLLAGLALALLVGLGAVTWVWRGAEAMVAGGWLAVVVALGLFGVKAMWGLNVARAWDPRELMIGVATAPDVRAFVAEMEALSEEEAGDAHTLVVTVDAATGPVVSWYLREFEQQKVVEGLLAPPDTVAAVTLARQDLPIGETFRGQGFPLRTFWLPWGMDARQTVRWLLFEGGSLPTVDQEVVVWVAGQR